MQFGWKPSRVEEHWRLSMAAHFAEEERLISLAKEKLDADAVARVLSEHAELRVLATGPCMLEPRARLSRFGELVARTYATKNAYFSHSFSRMFRIFR